MKQDKTLAERNLRDEGEKDGPGADEAQEHAAPRDASAGVTPEAIPWRQQLRIALRLLIMSLLFFSVLYPAFVSLVGQTLWRSNAQGGIVESNGVPVGAELIGQSFNSDVFFHPRPSSKGYDAMNSGSQNLGPLSEALTTRVSSRLEELQEEGIDPARVPADWVTESGSSLDPHITPAAARLQAPRISQASGLSPATLESVIEEHTEGKFLGIFGWERVNVLLLNLDVQTRLGEQQ